MKFKTGKYHLIGSSTRHELPMTKRGNELTSEIKNANSTSPPWTKIVLRPFYFGHSALITFSSTIFIRIWGYRGLSSPDHLDELPVATRPKTKVSIIRFARTNL